MLAKRALTRPHARLHQGPSGDPCSPGPRHTLLAAEAGTQGLLLSHARVLEGAGALPGTAVRPLLGRRGLAGPHPWSCSPARPLPTQRDGHLRREVTGVLPPLLVSAPGHAEVHGPVGHLGEGRVSRAAPRSGPRPPAARGSPRPTAGTAASCRPSYTPAARRRHSTCTGRWAGP